VADGKFRSKTLFVLPDDFKMSGQDSMTRNLAFERTDQRFHLCDLDENSMHGFVGFSS
jgi:hypothetical protein